MRTEEEVLQLIEPYKLKLNSCFEKAISNYKLDHLDSGLSHKYSTRTIANIIRDYIISEVKSKFFNEIGIHIYDKKGLFLLLIGDEVIVKFKKLNEKKLASGIKTKQLLLFVNQKEQLLFNDLRTNLHAGYIADSTRTNFDYPFIASPKGIENNHWYVYLNEEQTIPSIFTIETVSADNTKTPRFRLKKEIVNKDVASE